MRSTRGVIWMFAILLSAVAVWLPPAAGQNRPSPSVRRESFTSPEGVFHFSCPSDFPLCPAGDIRQCVHSYIPTCEEAAVACVAYPRDAFNGTNVQGAGFQVKEIIKKIGGHAAPLGSAGECVNPRPVIEGTGLVEPYTDFVISVDHPVEVIGSVSFIHGVIDDAAVGTYSNADLYRAFHAGRCYELRVTTARSAYEAYDPGTIKKFTSADEKTVLSSMSEILHSFRFAE
jgi:hypothetical protein